MCANIVVNAALAGSARGPRGWFGVDRAFVSYDHPFHSDLEHALNIDFVNEAQGMEGRVAVELTLASARELAGAILAAVERAERYEGITEPNLPSS